MRYFSPALIIVCLLLSACASSDSRIETAATTPTASAPQPLPDAGAMIKRMITQDGCKDFVAEMRMVSEAENGKRDQVEFRVQRKYAGNRALTFLAVLAPLKDTSKALLAVEEEDQPTYAFSYLAGLRKLSRVNSDRQLSFHNARVTVQDMLAMELGQYERSAGERVNTDGESLIKVEFKQKPWRNLAYPRITGFFREKDQSPASFELYDIRNELQKRVMIEEVKPVQNRQTITRLAIEDHQQKLKIKIETRKIEYDRGLPDSLFTEEYLKSYINNAVRKLDQK